MARRPYLLLAPWGTLRGSPPTSTTSLYIGHNRIHREEVLEMEEDIQIEVGGRYQRSPGRRARDRRRGAPEGGWRHRLTL
uniref:Uncharacterized protein n=1 Tax=Aegilops tauschii TaxID=37682 RepID=M8ASN2_AEGTA